jgi:glycosyltransferase involved in cell wall biosynthesis
MKFSIIIPTWNRASMLRRCILSALNQTFTDLEILVADNASTDETPDVARSFGSRIRYVRRPTNLGMVGNWRQCLLESKGEWFILLSDDDELVDPRFLTDADYLIKHNPKLVCIIGGVLYDNSQGFSGLKRGTTAQLPQLVGVEDNKNLFLTFGDPRSTQLPTFVPCSVIFKRDEASNLSAFSSAHNIFCDTELFLKLLMIGDVASIDRVVAKYTLHGGNLSLKVKDNFELMLGNLEYLATPMRMALERGFCTNKELADSYLAHTAKLLVRIYFANCGESFPSRAREFLHSAESLFPDGVLDTANNWQMTFRLALCEKAPLLFKALRQARIVAEKVTGLGH